MMSRRQMLSGLAGAAALGPPAARAARQCSGAAPNGIATCDVGVEIGAIETARQRCPYWCWAAAVQTIFALHGRRIEQERVVEHLFGSSVCAPADGQMIVQAVNGSWTDDAGGSFAAWADTLWDAGAGIWRPDSMDQIVAELAAGHPLVNGSGSHATVLTAASYMEDGYGRKQITSVIVRDPWPDSPNRRTLSMAEMQSTFFVAKVGVADA